MTSAISLCFGVYIIVFEQAKTYRNMTIERTGVEIGKLKVSNLRADWLFIDIFAGGKVEV